MSLARVILGNRPPVGHGVYSRDQPVDFLAQFDFVLVHAGRGDAEEKGRALVQRGKQVWFYDLPSGWQPTDDEVANIRHIEMLCDATGGVGGLANPENGWPSASNERAQRFADNIRASIGRGYRWGLNFYPEHPKRAILASSGAWGSPSFFHPQDVAWWSRWVDLFGFAMVIPSVPLWPRVLAPPSFTWTESTFDAHLASIPGSVGAIGFPAIGVGNGWMRDAYLAWSPSGGALGAVLQWVASRGTTPLGIGVVLVFVLLVTLAVIARAR